MITQVRATEGWVGPLVLWFFTWTDRWQSQRWGCAVSVVCGSATRNSALPPTQGHREGLPSSAGSVCCLELYFCNNILGTWSEWQRHALTSSVEAGQCSISCSSTCRCCMLLASSSQSCRGHIPTPGAVQRGKCTKSRGGLDAGGGLSGKLWT